MASRVYLHIGASKSGTTYLQHVLDANRHELERNGVLFPAPLMSHFRFMRHLVGRQGGAPPPKVADAAFDTIVQQSREHTGPVVVSNELLAGADDGQLMRLATIFEPAELHVVYTIRDLSRTVSAEWQQAIKGGSTLTLDEFVSGVAAGFGRPPAVMPSVVGESQVVEKFGVLHDVATLLPRWAAHLQTAHVHVVTVPPPGSDPDLLWKRFCAAIDLDPALGVHPPRRRNESLGAAEVEALRRLNLELSGDGRYDFVRSEWVRHRFVLPVLMPRPVSARIALRDRQRAWAAERAADIVAFLEQSEYDVVGDVSDLLPAAETQSSVHPSDVTEAALNAILTDWVATLLMRARGNDRGKGRPSEA